MSTTESTGNATTTEAAHLARSLIREHGLTGWGFQFDRAKRRFGLCSHSRRLISLSEPLVRLNTLEQVRTTILHEIAHALVGPHQGHGPVWKAKARSLGIKPERCYNAETTASPEAPFRFVCDNCGTTIPRHRRSTRRPACSPCCKRYNGGRYTDAYLLRLERNR